VTAGFDQAFADVFAERSGSLYRYISALSGDPALAEDIVQESFVRLYRRGRMPDDPAAWLVSVAHNLWRDDRRRDVRRSRLLSLRRDELPTMGESPATDATTLASERVQTVHQALARLPERDRRLLLLRHAGFAYREIALALDLAPGSVGKLLVRASESFRTAFYELFGASA